MNIKPYISLKNNKKKKVSSAVVMIRTFRVNSLVNHDRRLSEIN